MLQGMAILSHLRTGERNGSLALHYGAAHGHANVVKMCLI